LTMRSIASGFYTGHPSEYLVFTNVLVGCLLKGAYCLWNSFDWYVCYLLLVHFTALTGLAFLVLRRQPGWRFPLLYSIIFLQMEPRLFLHLQFTTTAFLVGLVGLLLLVDALQSGHRVNFPTTVFGLMFLTAAILIRDLVVLQLAIVALPFLVDRFGLK